MCPLLCIFYNQNMQPVSVPVKVNETHSLHGFHSTSLMAFVPRSWNQNPYAPCISGKTASLLRRLDLFQTFWQLNVSFTSSLTAVSRSSNAVFHLQPCQLLRALFSPDHCVQSGEFSRSETLCCVLQESNHDSGKATCINDHFVKNENLKGQRNNFSGQLGNLKSVVNRTVFLTLFSLPFTILLPFLSVMFLYLTL